MILWLDQPMPHLPSLAVDDLSKSELKELVLNLLGEVAELKQMVAEQSRIIAQQREEIARLKRLNGRSDIKPSKPSGMEQASERKARSSDRKHRGRGKKKPPRDAVDDQVVKVVVSEEWFDAAIDAQNLEAVFDPQPRH